MSKLECLRELRTFVTLARLSNIGRAARELGDSQPTVSKQLVRLEEQLGAQLFVRHGRGISLTAEGGLFLDRASQALTLLESPLSPAPLLGRSAAKIVIVVPEEFAWKIANFLVTDYGNTDLGQRIEIETSNAIDPLSRLTSGQVTLAVVQQTGEVDGLVTRPAFTDRIGLAVSPRSPLARIRDPLKLRDLLAVPLIMLPTDYPLRRVLDDAAFRAGFRFSVSCTVDRVSAIKAVVREGNTAAILPLAAVQDELAIGALAYRPIARPVISVTHSIAYRITADPEVADVASLLHTILREISKRNELEGVNMLTESVA